MMTHVTKPIHLSLTELPPSLASAPEALTSLLRATIAPHAAARPSLERMRTCAMSLAMPPPLAAPPRDAEVDAREAAAAATFACLSEHSVDEQAARFARLSEARLSEARVVVEEDACAQGLVLAARLESGLEARLEQPQVAS